MKDVTRAKIPKTLLAALEFSGMKRLKRQMEM